MCNDVSDVTVRHISKLLETEIFAIFSCDCNENIDLELLKLRKCNYENVYLLISFKRDEIDNKNVNFDSHGHTTL